MAKFSGSRADFGIGKETTRGTSVAAGYWVRNATYSVDDKVNLAVEEVNRNLIEDSIDAQVVGTYAEGEVSGPMRDRLLGLLLLSAFGTDTPATHSGESIVYDHVLTVAQSNQHQSLTYWLKNPNQTKKFVLGMLNSLELNVELGKHAMFNAKFRAKAGATDTASPSYVSENIFLPNHGAVRFASSYSGLGAAPDINLRSCKLTINKGLVEDRILGQTAVNDFNNTLFSVEGEITLTYDDDTYIDFLNAGTTRAMRLALTNAGITLGVGTNPSLTVNLAKCIFKEISRKNDRGDLVLQTLAFKGLYSETDSLLANATLVNLVASY